MLAVLFDEGAPNPSLDKILASAPHQVGKVPADKLELVAADLLPDDRGYYAYSGSLTTPPCTEGVRWFVLRSPRTVSAKQVAAFREVTGTNARDPQPLNARLVLR